MPLIRADQLAVAPGGRGDDRDLEGEGLHDRPGQALPVAGQDERVGAGDHRADIPDEAGEVDAIAHAEPLGQGLETGPLGAVAEEGQPSPAVGDERQRLDHVGVALVRVELGDDDEERHVRSPAELLAGTPDLIRVELRARIDARFEADPGHPHQTRGRHDPMAPGRLEILVVDDHQPIGPAAGDPLRRHEEGVGRQRAILVEVEPVRGIGQGWSSRGGHPADRDPGDQAGDRGMDVDQVVTRLEDGGHRALAAEDPADVEDRARQGQLVDVIEGLAQGRVAGGRTGRGIDPPAQGPEMGRIGQQEAAQRSGDGGHDEQRDAPGKGRPQRCDGVDHLPPA